jgi:hypothetical protein
MNCKKKPTGDSGNQSVNNLISFFFDKKTKKVKKLIALSYALL